VLAGIFALFFHFHQNDVKAFSDFFASYGKFDKAISDFYADNTPDLESKLSNALTELDAKATTFRISSLVENDAELIKKASEIADLSEIELNSLKSYKKAVVNKDADLDSLEIGFGDLTKKRKIAYAHFRELAGLKD